MTNQFQDALDAKIRQIVTEVLEEMLLEGKVPRTTVKKSVSPSPKRVSSTNKKGMGNLKGRVTDRSRDMRLKENRDKKR